MIYIIIPVFNRKIYTRACLSTLAQQSFKEYKIIVIDHGSNDGTSEMIENDFPFVILLKGDEEMWWTAATNLGVQKAIEMSVSQEDFVLTLNNDLEVNPEYLYEIFKIYEQNKPCLVGSTSVYIDNTEKISFIGSTWNKYSAKYKPNRIILETYLKVSNKLSYIQSDLLPGRGTLIPISVFKKIGFFDEINFPHYTADEDFSLRAKNIGYKLLVSINACVKSHVNDNIKIKSIRDFYNSLFTIRSANNLKYRFRWAKKHSPITILYFIFDFIRLFGSFVKNKIKINTY